jgi:hypothetical protein
VFASGRLTKLLPCANAAGAIPSRQAKKIHLDEYANRVAIASVPISSTTDVMGDSAQRRKLARHWFDLVHEGKDTVLCADFSSTGDFFGLARIGS